MSWCAGDGINCSKVIHGWGLKWKDHEIPGEACMIEWILTSLFLKKLSFWRTGSGRDEKPGLLAMRARRRAVHCSHMHTYLTMCKEPIPHLINLSDTSFFAFFVITSTVTDEILCKTWQGYHIQKHCLLPPVEQFMARVSGSRISDRPYYLILSCKIRLERHGPQELPAYFVLPSSGRGFAGTSSYTLASTVCLQRPWALIL